MKLLLDIGNTRIKWAWLDGGVMQGTGDGLHRGPGVAAALGGLLALNLAPTEVRLANVAGNVVGEAVAREVAAAWPVDQRWARAAPAARGLRNGYLVPGQLGVDRWLALCAAWPGPGHSLCLVAAGSALTVDLVDGGGQHRGGLIVPGLAMMVAALRDGTGDLARLAVGGPAQPAGQAGWLALDTGTAMAAGALRSAVSLVVDCWRQVAASLPGPAALVLTGGDGPRLAAALAGTAGVVAEVRPDLVLEGLALEPPCFVEAT